MESAVVGRVKWFDPDRGFGFLVCEGIDRDVMVHKSILRDHGMKSLPEGAVCLAEIEQRDRGLQAIRVANIDLRDAQPPRERRQQGHRSTNRLTGPVGDWEAVETLWFSRTRGYGFVDRGGVDVFVHAETLAKCDIAAIVPGQRIEARIARGVKGLIVAEARVL